MTRTRTIPKPPCSARAFSLLEGAIALTILGIGLIMIAAIFPVALSQHRDSVDLARASETASKAEAIMKARLSDTALWSSSDPTVSKSEWLMLPMMNLAAGAGSWDIMPALAPPSFIVASTYANVISGVNEADVLAGKQNPTILMPMENLSDRVAPYTAGDPSSPFTDFEFGVAASRTVWIGFYRKLPTLTTFAAAICKQRRGQLFAEQNLNPGASPLHPVAMNPFSTPVPITSGFRRLPVPWRVSIGAINLGTTQSPRMQLFNTADQNDPKMLGDGVPLGVLAPVGSKLLMQGALRSSDPAILPEAPKPRVLTVSSVLFDSNNSPTVVEVLEDITDVPPHDFAPGVRVVFDIWLFPPPVVNLSEFGTESPLLDWRFQ